MKGQMKQRLRVLLLLAVWLFLLLTGCTGTQAAGTAQAVTRSTQEAAVREARPPGIQKAEKKKKLPTTQEAAETEDVQAAEKEVREDGTYSDKAHVAAYLHLYGRLPSNYITKKEAEKRGWDSRAGNLWEVAPDKSIGGSRFGNYEGLLPEAEGRQYYECDIDYEGGYRGAKRIIYSDDGLIFYTEDHYKTFEQLY